MLHRRQTAIPELQARAEAGVAHLGRPESLQGPVRGVQPAQPVPRTLRGAQTEPGDGAAVQTDSLALHGGGEGPGLAVVTGPDRH